MRSLLPADWVKKLKGGVRNERETLQIDIITFGKKVKKEVKEKEKAGLKQLVPQRIPNAI